MDASFTLKSVQQMLGLSRTVVNGLVTAGFVTPQRGRRNEQRFSFQDLLLLRTAHGLQRAEIPPRKILSALATLASTLPEELPLTGLRITAVGSEVAVHEGGSTWNPETQQVLMDFDVAAEGSTITILPRSLVPPATAMSSSDVSPSAQNWFALATTQELSDEEAAEHSYRQALALDDAFEDAYINLGALLCESGRCDEAVALFQIALEKGTTSPTIHFNHAIALEDMGLLHRAIQSYESALAIDPEYRDAHYNAGLLHDKMGNPQKALAHLNAYRRLQQA